MKKAVCFKQILNLYRSKTIYMICLLFVFACNNNSTTQPSNVTEASLEKSNLTPMTAFVHMANNVAAVQWAMDIGANGVEIDLQFDSDGSPKEFHHGTPCDCSCLCPIGSTCSKDNVCRILWDATGSHCNAKEDAETMASFLARFPKQLAVIYIDSKVTDGNIDLTKAGENVIKLLDEKTIAAGYTGQIIINTPKVAQIDYAKAAVKAANLSPNKEKYFFTIDQEGSDFLKAMNSKNGLLSLPTKNRVYSTGISVCVPSTYFDAIKLAAYNEKIGVIGSTGIWTLDNSSSMSDYITDGANSVMTNTPDDLLSTINTMKRTLAKPGQALTVATSDSLATQLPPSM